MVMHPNRLFILPRQHAIHMAEMLRRADMPSGKWPDLREPHVEEGFIRDVIGDFLKKVQVAPVGTVAFTGLNVVSSLIPSASFLLSDAIIARAVQHYIDPKFQLMYDRNAAGKTAGSMEGEDMKRMLVSMLLQGYHGNKREQANVRKVLDFIRDHAYVSGHDFNPLKGPKKPKTPLS